MSISLVRTYRLKENTLINVLGFKDCGLPSKALLTGKFFESTSKRVEGVVPVDEKLLSFITDESAE